jgi:DNA-binding SARP family transcriptional activator
MLHLSALGEVAVWKDDEPVPELPAQRLRCAVLVYLAVERSVLRDDLLGMFWPDRDSSRGRHALRQMLYELRRVLGNDWLELGRDRLLVRGLAVDTADFESAAEAGHCDAAIALYRGSFLRGFSVDSAAFEAWADRRRAHHGRLYRRLQRQQLAAWGVTLHDPVTQATLNWNDFTRTHQALHQGATAPSDLTCNWWGSPAGPAGVSAAQGPSLYTPWATAPVAAGGTTCTGGITP